MHRPFACTALALALVIGLGAATDVLASIERGRRPATRAVQRVPAVFPRVVRDDFVRRLAAKAPPSIEEFEPVIEAASWLARKTVSAATCSTVTNWRVGWRDSTCFLAAS